jgi:hypothetical protein
VLPCIIGRTKLRITHLIAGRGRRPLDGIFVAVICVVSAATLAGHQLTLLYEGVAIVVEELPCYRLEGHPPILCS